MRDSSASPPDAAEPGEPDAVSEAGREDDAGGLAAAVARSRAIGLDGTFGPVARGDDAGLWLAPGTHEPEAPEGTATQGEGVHERAGDREARAAILAKAPVLDSITVDPPRPVVLSAPCADEAGDGQGAAEGVTGNDSPGGRGAGSAFRRGRGSLDETGPVPPLPAIPESIRVPEGVTLPPGIRLPQGVTVFDGPVQIAAPLLDPEQEAPAGEPGRHRARPGKHARGASEEAGGAGNEGAAGAVQGSARADTDDADETAGQAEAGAAEADAGADEPIRPGESSWAEQPSPAAAPVQPPEPLRAGNPAESASPGQAGEPERPEPVAEQEPSGRAAHAAAVADQAATGDQLADQAASTGPVQDGADHGEAEPDPELLRDTAELPDADALAAQDAIAAREKARWAPDLRADEERAGREALSYAPAAEAAWGEAAPGGDAAAGAAGAPPLAAHASAVPGAPEDPVAAAGSGVASGPGAGAMLGAASAAGQDADAGAGPAAPAGPDSGAGPDAPAGRGTSADSDADAGLSPAAGRSAGSGLDAGAGPDADAGPGAGRSPASGPDAPIGSDASTGPDAAAAQDAAEDSTPDAHEDGEGHASDEPEPRGVLLDDAERDASSGKRTIEVDARDPAGEDVRQLLFPAEGGEASSDAAEPVRVRNAGFAFLIGLAGSAVFAALYLAAFAFLRALFTGQGDALRWAIAYTPTAPFWLPVAGFGVLFLLWGRASNRSRWGSYIVGGLLAGVAGFLLYHCGVAVQRMLNGEGPLGDPLASLSDEAHLLGALVSAIAARETFTWFGGLIAARAGWLRRRARRGDRS